MVTIPINTLLIEIIIIYIPSIQTILLLSKSFPIAHRHIIKINITHVCIINHKLIHIGVNLSNNTPKIKFYSLRPILNPTVIISRLLLQSIQPISKFIGHTIHMLSQTSSNLKNQLVDKKYKFLTHSLTCLYSSCVLLKHSC